MVDIVLVTTLVACIVNSLLQAIQMVLDYKKSKHDGTSEIYELKQYSSNCCTTIVETSDEEQK